MARPTFTDACNLARQICDDREQAIGLVFSDTDLVPFGTSVQRKVWRALCKAGLEDANVFATRTITSADSAISFTVPSGQTLPEDFVRPLKLWEKGSGAGDNTYTLMTNAAERLPDEPSTDTLRYWVFEDATGPTIKFLGVTATRTVRILYYREATPITAGSTTLYIPGSVDAIAMGVLARVAVSRGEPQVASFFNGEFQAEIDDMLAIANKGVQRRHRRRAPYSVARYF